jgi:membrane protease YdiL (CAAX protease family)
MTAPSRTRRVLEHPLSRIVLFLLMFGFMAFGVHLAVVQLGWAAKTAPEAQRIAAHLLRQVLPAIAAYLILVRLIEMRRPEELAWRKLLPHGAAGFAGGALLLASVIGVLWLAGAYRVVDLNPGVNWAMGVLVVGLGAGISEEIVFRGVVFRITDESLGLWPAIAISALFFGGVHMGNPNATLWTSAAIAVEAGILLGMVYHATRSLPVCIGLHMAWNLFEGTVFGSPVSGVPTRQSLFVPEFSGPDWLTGGSFGIEASVVTVGLCLAASATLLVAQRRRQAQNRAVAVEAAPC